MSVSPLTLAWSAPLLRGYGTTASTFLKQESWEMGSWRTCVLLVRLLWVSYDLATRCLRGAWSFLLDASDGEEKKRSKGSIMSLGVLGINLGYIGCNYHRHESNKSLQSDLGLEVISVLRSLSCRPGDLTLLDIHVICRLEGERRD